MLAYGENLHRVNAAHVKLAARDTPGVGARSPWWQRVWRWGGPSAHAGLSDSVIGSAARSKP